NRPRAKTLVHVLELGHQLAGALAGVHSQPDRAQALAPGGALLAQVFEPFDPALVASAARFDALADPDFFLRPELLEAAVGEILGRIQLRLALFVDRVVARKAAQPSAVELGDAAGHRIEETPVVG